MTNLTEPPDGIIITISQAMIKEKGYRNWLRNFFKTMSDAEQDDPDGWTYWFRVGNKPKHDVAWVYLLIGGKIRFRVNWIDSFGAERIAFTDGKSLYGKGWVVVCGPVARPEKPIYRKGFRGFRYTHKLF